jgi:ABC-type antimicrobial peptide transport system permease subunit
LYGVKTSEFEGRFTFSEGNWTSLQEASNGVIPALVDQNTLMWALKKGVGDRMQFLDGGGQPFEIELKAVVKGSLLQGALYLDENLFLEKFPQQGGYRFFFLEGAKEVSDEAARHLESKLSHYGLDLQTTSARLEELNKVENTYLSIFQGLGGLGLLLGTAGLGVVVARNLMERGKEYALMEALGYELSTLRALALKEHLKLALWGVGIGSLSALVGIAPAFLGMAGELPGKEFAWFFLLLLGLGIFWTWLSVSLNLRTSRLKLLNDE